MSVPKVRALPPSYAHLAPDLERFCASGDASPAFWQALGESLEVQAAVDDRFALMVKGIRPPVTSPAASGRQFFEGLAAMSAPDRPAQVDAAVEGVPREVLEVVKAKAQKW